MQEAPECESTIGLLRMPPKQMFEGISVAQKAVTLLRWNVANRSL